MEYPFKDLLPLDEVLEREGYYKDWTHLDPEVFYSLTQISEYIKTKGYGVDVRLLIAQLAEHFGLKSTQIIDLANLLQQKFDNLEGVTQSFTNNINSLVAQMEADKDAVIANATVDSEVILSRGEFQTLGERLENADAQMAQTTMDVITGVIQPDIGEYITTNGFYEFGNTYRYAVLPVNGDENFSDSGKGFSISLQGEIKISDNAKITPVPSDRVSVGALGCNNVDDDKCFQSAYNLAKLRDCNVDVDVNVTIVDHIDIHRDGSDEGRRIIEFSGRGIITKTTPWYLFANTLSRSGGNIKFNGIHFRSEAGAGTVIFHGGYLLRMYFENCHFLNVDRLTNTVDTDPWNYLQTVYVDSSTFVGGKGWLVEAHTAYDVSINHSIVEHREKFIKIDMNHSVRITDNLIEGIEGKVLEVKQGRSLVFDDNYMEHNGTIIEEPSITIDNPSFNYGYNEMMNFSFKNNLYIGTDTQINDANYYLMSIKNWGKTITVTNNFCDCNFLVVENRDTVSLMPTSLMDIYSNTVANAKKVLNDFNAPTFVSLGSGNLLKEFFDRPLYVSQFVAFNPDLNNITTQDDSLVIIDSETGSSSNKIGFKIENILLARNTTYAVGLAALCFDANKESDGVQVVFTNRSTGSIVYKDLIEITDISITRGRVPFYSLNPFNNIAAQHVDIEVSMVPKSGDFSSSVLQRLSVANVVLQRGVVATDAIY